MRRLTYKLAIEPECPKTYVISNLHEGHNRRVASCPQQQ